ncbi:MAG: DNA methyltransferase [Bryobacteraceae bacterium]
MAIDRERARAYLKSFDFRRLFLEQLGWDKHSGLLEKVVDGRAYQFQAVSEKRGVAVLICDCIPEYSVRVKLDKLVAKDHFEHLIVFADRAAGRQIWQWMRRESGKPHAIRAYTYSTGQSGELILQKLEHLAVAIEEEELVGMVDLLGRVQAGFDVEKVTKKFYERFKEEHDRFLKFVDGIPDEQMGAWYASVMINRLMFLYFIQAKSFLNGDQDYLRNKLKESRDRKKDGYYRDFLCPLFFEGFARKKEERSAAVNKLLGAIPYLNGGLFQRHQIEELHGKKIQIADTAFERLFGFFREYTWHLDERENRNDREINPDVLGYIFEKYINQKQMGAYYTKEDITGYISQNTIIPFVLDTARKDRAVASEAAAGVWRLLQDDPDRYIYAPVRHGTGLELPADIAAGLSTVKKRSGWNKPAPPEYALPTEIWREVVERRRRYEEVRGKLAKGEVSEVNDLITLNLDVRQFAQDVIQFCESPDLLRAMYKAISKVSVLDPTCGSGAFLFAALNILRPLYEACLQRMQMFVDELDAGPAHHPRKFEDFRQILEESKQHPKQDYFILKSIIVNNLYGVDIMEEAVEICKLRLFLKLVAQVDSPDRIEPLPDIDFNIRAGNTLIGYTRISDIRSGQANLYLEEQLRAIEDKAKRFGSAIEMFRQQQTSLNGTVTVQDKLTLRQRFGELEDDLNDFLAAEYGVKKADGKNWKASHKPFHWFSDFHRIMQSGGFDIVVGNPRIWRNQSSTSRSPAGPG